MVEKYLGKDQAEDLFMASMISGLMPEKQAEHVMDGMEKDGFSIGRFLKGLFGVGTGVASLPFKVIPALATSGLATGAVAGGAYHYLKDSLTKEDPKENLNLKAESMYVNRKRELEDARWMNRVRAMRDELKREYKKMSPEEYTSRYNALIDALDERKD